MSVKNESKINQLLQEVPTGAVYLASWMKQNNIPHSTQHRYVASAWLTPIGTGAMIRTGNTPTLYGAIYSLNTQADKHLTIGAMSALEIHGYSHYLPMGRPTVSLSAPQKEYLPLWFRKYDWGVTLRLFTTETFNSDTDAPSRTMMSATLLILAALPTEVPPNFKTFIILFRFIH